MVPERWRQISEIFHAALGRDEASQRAFLDVACMGDESLRREVESLLAYPSDVEPLLGVPTGESMGTVLEVRQPPNPVSLPPGVRLGPYEIVSLIGRGA